MHVLAGKCSEPVEREYFRTEVEPRLGPGVELLGVADATTKRDLLSRARCLLFPICWDEPFGLVMVEALACGTPVVALRWGAVPEVVDDGVTGIVVDKEEDLVDAVHASAALSPHACRSAAEDRGGVPETVFPHPAPARRAGVERGNAFPAVLRGPPRRLRALRGENPLKTGPGRPPVYLSGVPALPTHPGASPWPPSRTTSVT